MLVFPILYASVLVMLSKMLRSTAVHKTWLWATLFIVIVCTASTPAVWATAVAVAEEWCESQPGGRGYASNGFIAEIPLACCS